MPAEYFGFNTTSNNADFVQNHADPSVVQRVGRQSIECLRTRGQQTNLLYMQIYDNPAIVSQSSEEDKVYERHER
jgi:hypothetical protein